MSMAALLLLWWKITSHLKGKRKKRKGLWIKRKPIIPFKNYNDVVHRESGDSSDRVEWDYAFYGCKGRLSGYTLEAVKYIKLAALCFQCEKQNMYLHNTRDKNIFSFRLCAPSKAFTFTNTSTRWVKRVFSFFFSPSTKILMGKIFFSVPEFSDGKRFATFVGWISHPFTLFFSSVSLSNFPLNMLFSTKCVFVSFLSDESFSPSLSRLEQKSYVFSLNFSCVSFLFASLF